MPTAPGLNARMDYLSLTLSLSDFGIYFGEGAVRPIRGNKATANQSPVLSFVGEESYSKGRLRVSNGLCKDSTMMQSTTPSNSDF
jgi:hypothetical protein